jgi:hypothetical protein
MPMVMEHNVRRVLSFRLGESLHHLDVLFRRLDPPQVLERAIAIPDGDRNVVYGQREAVGRSVGRLVGYQSNL